MKMSDKNSNDSNMNDPNPGDSESAAKEGGGGGTSGEVLSNKTKDEVYELTVDGEKRSVTLKEALALAQKSAGADKRFQEAAELKKTADQGLRIQSLLESVKENPTDSDVRELAVLLGEDPDVFQQWMNESGDEYGKSGSTSKKTSGGKISKDDLAIGLKELGLDPIQVKSIVNFSHQRHIEDARKEIRKISDEAIDKDEFFGKIGIGENGKDRLAIVKDIVNEDVLRKIQDGLPFGADMIAASIQKTRAIVSKFGIPNKSVQYPVVMGLGPGQGLPAEVQSEEPIKRVSAAEDGDEKNVVARYMQKALRMMRKSG
uniref:Uncharacterized protein n=1 Tax=viral metagenome TaxID=1070528 RepID=A0A6M3IH73_9ZZZZ